MALAALLLTGCVGGTLDATTPADQPSATAAWSKAVKSGEVPAGKGRVYVFLGAWRFPEAQWFKETKNITPSDVYVNDMDVGGLNPGECLAFDLPPGEYSFAWFERSKYPYPSAALKKTIGAGQTLFLSVDADQHVSGAFPNPVNGYLTEQHDGLSVIKAMTIVMPDAEAVKRLVPDAGAPL